MPKKFVPATEGCDDCEYIAKETEGDITICPECSGEDDGQPDWYQEWEDFGEVYDDSYDFQLDSAQNFGHQMAIIIWPYGQGRQADFVNENNDLAGTLKPTT